MCLDTTFPVTFCEGCPHCGTMKVERNGYCATYNFEQRKIDRAKHRQNVAIKKVSAKRSVQNKEYARLRDSYLSVYKVCEVVDCHNRSNQIHHMAGRDGDKLTDPDNFLAVCPDCHRRITEDSAWAISQGYSILRSN